MVCTSWFDTITTIRLGFPGGEVVKNLPASALGQENPWSRKWQSLPGESYGHRSLAGYRPFGHKESDTTEVT